MKTTNKERLFKVLGKDRQPCHGGSGKWPLRKWREATGPLVLCENGLHLCRESDLVHWLGPEIWEVEYEGERLDGEDKIVVRKARLVRKVKSWNDRTARLFACDCAERVLPIYEKRHPDEPRLRVVIDTARRYANGEATKKELTAAWAAAWAAAGAAAGDAAWAAAWAAAGDAARTAAWAAERKWQTARLMEYLYGEVGKQGEKCKQKKRA